MSDNALSFSPTKWSIIGAAFSNGHENQEKNQDCGNRPICCGCNRHQRENSEWVVFSDKTWWHAFCAAEELFRQLAQRDERNAALEARVLRLERGLREIETLVPEPYQFPVDWDEQVASCADCRRFANHPIQQGICDTHRRPLWARDRHDANEEARLGYRAMKLARKVLEEAGHE